MNERPEDDDINPFICTLGEAAKYNAGKHQPFKTVRDLIDVQASRNPDEFAVGFPAALSRNEDGQEGDSITLSTTFTPPASTCTDFDRSISPAARSGP